MADRIADLIAHLEAALALARELEIDEDASMLDVRLEALWKARDGR